MVVRRARRRGDLGARAFAWYWRRLAARARDPGRFLRIISARKAELDRVAAEIEGEIARGRKVDLPMEDARWRHRLACLTTPVRPGVLVDPAPGAPFGADLTLHHQGGDSAFTVSQRPSRRDADRFELFFESYEFSSPYFSLSVTPPDNLRRPMTDERLTLEADISSDWLMKAYVRLNIRGLAGEETLFAERMLGDGKARFEFDFAFVPFDMSESDALWIDVIFDRPRMVAFTISDLVVSLEDA